jgi:hypothetical protein
MLEFGAFALGGNLPAPGKDFRLRAGGLRFLDVAVAIIKQRQTRPAYLVVGLKFSRLFAGFDRLRETAEFHQGHAKGVPTIEKRRVELNATAVFLDRRLQLAHGKIAVGVIEELVARRHR